MILDIKTLDHANVLTLRCRKYKYQVTNINGYTLYIGLLGYSIDNQYYKLTPDGYITAKCMYAYDGPSGPTKDDEHNLVPALVHDIIYQAIRRGELPMSVKEFADDLLQTMMIERGASKKRAQMYHDGVHLFAASSCQPGTDDLGMLVVM